jgi:uncharacterized protein (TIGR00251 family)
MSSRHAPHGTRHTSPIQPTATGVRLRVYVQPRASRTELAGLHGDAVRIRLAAPPVEGEANQELVRFLARVLGVPRSAVTIATGAGSRRKGVAVLGLSAEAARQRLALGDG